MQRTIAAGVGAVIGLATFGLSVEMAIAERPRGTNCIAGYSQCKAKANGSQPAINACLKEFNQCVSDNKDQHYNPYGYPNRIGNSPAVLKDVPGVSIGKAGAVSGVRAINPGTAATMTTGIGGAQAVDSAAAAVTTTSSVTLSAPAKPFTSRSKGISGGASITQPGRSNLRVQ